ncbi:MAG: DUF1292 domain-containing protein [Coprococcus sp.]|nr:DUF1292 domain-containing protein [Coprococcus sp.]
MGRKRDKHHKDASEEGGQTQPEYVTLTLDNDEEVTCRILTVLEVDSKEYIALQPLDQDGNDAEGGEWLYQFTRDETGGDMHKLNNIEDDDEFEKVLYRFDEWLDFTGFYQDEFFAVEEEEGGKFE